MSTDENFRMNQQEMSETDERRDNLLSQLENNLEFFPQLMEGVVNNIHDRVYITILEYFSKNNLGEYTLEMKSFIKQHIRDQVAPLKDDAISFVMNLITSIENEDSIDLSVDMESVNRIRNISMERRIQQENINDEMREIDDRPLTRPDEDIQ